MNPVTLERLRKTPWVLRYRAGAHLASEFRRLMVLATHQHCRVEFQGPVRLGPGFRLHIPDHGTLVVGKGVEFRRGFICEISGNGRVSVGSGSIFTSNVLIQCSTSIDIGVRCIFAQSVLLVDGSHRFRDASKSVLDLGYDYRPLVIGDDVMVLSQSVVFADIADRTVVGANSVVSRPLPPRCLALGSPARPVEYFGGSRDAVFGETAAAFAERDANLSDAPRAFAGDG